MEWLEGRALLSVVSIEMMPPDFQEGTVWPASGLGEVATFTTNDGGEPYQYNVTINWGDGTAPTSASVNYDAAYDPTSNPLFDINSAHTYRNAGDYSITVSIQDSVDDTSAATTPDEGEVTVAPQALTPDNPQPPVDAVVGTALNNVPVATFTSGNSQALPSDFAATISFVAGHGGRGFRRRLLRGGEPHLHQRPGGRISDRDRHRPHGDRLFADRQQHAEDHAGGAGADADDGHRVGRLDRIGRVGHPRGHGRRHLHR